MVISANSSVTEIVKAHPGTRRVFDEHGLRGCGGEHGPAESLAFFAAVHAVDLPRLLDELHNGWRFRRVTLSGSEACPRR